MIVFQEVAVKRLSPAARRRYNESGKAGKTMKRLLGFLFPGDVDFFGPMENMYALIDECAGVYLDAAQKETLEPKQREELMTRMKRIERQGDLIVRTVSADLKKTFTPPFAPAELMGLFHYLDDILDRLDESAKTNIHAGYREGFPPFVKDQIDALRLGAAEAGRTVALLKKPRDNAALLVDALSRISGHETEGDAIYWLNKKEISRRLNAAARDGALAEYRRAIMDEKILDQLEEALDTLVKITAVIHGMIIEHA